MLAKLVVLAGHTAMLVVLATLVVLAGHTGHAGRAGHAAQVCLRSFTLLAVTADPFPYSIST